MPHHERRIETTQTLESSPLESRVRELERRLNHAEELLGALGPVSVDVSVEPGPDAPVLSRPVVSTEDRVAIQAMSRARPSVADLIGGRLLAWLGGLATLAGILLFLALAISRAWLAPEARVALAGGACAVLLGAGIWLHDRRGRTEASIVLVGTAVAGMFATLVVAGEVYALIDPRVGLACSVAVGGVATRLAVRWAGRAIGALGQLGALAMPALLGVAPTASSFAILALAFTFTLWTAASQQWPWLALSAVVVCALEWAGPPLLDATGIASAPVLAAAIGTFVVLGLLAAVGGAAARGSRGVAGWLALAGVNACLAAGLGSLALARQLDGTPLGEYGTSAVRTGIAIWLLGLAAAHALMALIRVKRLSVPETMRIELAAIALCLGDITFAILGSGVVLTIGWAVTALAFAALSRVRAGSTPRKEFMRGAAGLHVGLVLIRVLVLAPPGALAAGGLGLSGTVAVVALAASCLCSGALLGDRTRVLAQVLYLIGLAAITYLTALELHGAALVVAWSFEAATLGRIGARDDQWAARIGSAGLFALALGHAIVGEAPPSALISGADSLGSAAVALGAVAFTLVAARVRIGQPDGERVRTDSAALLLPGAAAVLVYLASVTIVTGFQPAGGAAVGMTVLDLPIRQEGQVLLSGFWSVVGLCALIGGLRLRQPLVRNVAFVVLLGTVAKVCLFDLAALTSIYRVISFIAVGLLLLAGAFVYQRMRPAPQPDMRSIHPSQR